VYHPQVMNGDARMRAVLRNMLQYGDLSFRDFVEIALYHPECGYYAMAQSPVGKGGDYVTSPTLSPVFSFALGRLVAEFLERTEGGVTSIVDIGCGDGALIRALAASAPPGMARFLGVDRSLERIPPGGSSPVEYATSLVRVERGEAQLVFSNELFDALPFARLVRRGEQLHELWVAESDGVLDWSEHEASPLYDDYFQARGIDLAEGQYADVSLDWGPVYGDLCDFVTRGLLVTFDYGYPGEKLFHSRARRFGTAAAYAGQQVSRDLLARPGQQDLTAHINFDDLIETGEGRGFTTLFFDRQAKFLLSLGITEHELFTPAQELTSRSAAAGMELLEARDLARQLVLPDGIGHDLRVLVQARGVEGSGWSFQKALFERVRG